MRRPRPSQLVALLALFALSAFALAGCGTNERLATAPVAGDPSSDIAKSVVSPDAAQFVSAMAAQNRATDALLQKLLVIGTGSPANAVGKLVIVIYTEREGIAGLPTSIEGIPTRVVVAGTVEAYSKPAITPNAKPGGGGTLQMGTSTGNDLECASGTLGCVVVKGGVDYFLSNNHVFARENDGSIGERIDAPGRYDGKPLCAQTPQIATLSQFQNISFNNNNTVDCAIARPISGLNYTAVTAGGYDPSSTVVSPAVGLAVKKTGRTSRLTHGNIQAINVTIQVQYSGGIAVFVNQIQTPGSFQRSGDSGSLMVTETGNNPVGLCFAGGSGASFANPIGPVLQAMGATVK